MSLDVYLMRGKTVELYSANITHNLNKMAVEAGIYQHLCRPDEIGVTKARELIVPLTEGLARLTADKAHYEQFNSPNAQLGERRLDKAQVGSSILSAATNENWRPSIIPPEFAFGESCF